MALLPSTTCNNVYTNTSTTTTETTYITDVAATTTTATTNLHFGKQLQKSIRNIGPYGNYRFSEGVISMIQHGHLEYALT